jgi:hypothetical protein
MTKSLRRIALPVVCVIALLQARPAIGQTPDDSIRPDIEKLMQLTGSAQMATQMVSTLIAQIVDGMKTSQPNIPERALAIAREVLETELTKGFSGPQSMMPQIAAAYANHFTQEDIRALVAFYESPIGKKMIQTMPVILQESIAIGQRWAQTEMPRIRSLLQERLRAEGFIK